MFYFGRKGRDGWWKERRIKGEDPVTYRWLTELAQHKASKLSCLERVEIVEEGGSVKWIAPETVEALFDTAGIALDVCLRGKKSEPDRLQF